MSENKKPSILSLEANLKGLKRMAVILVCLAVVGWLAIRFLAGEKAANQTAAAIMQRPIEIKNSVENVKASSMKFHSFKLPYTGTLSIEATVLKGNNLDVYLVRPDQVENMKADKQFNHFNVFSAEKTKNLKREGRLDAGEYVLVFHDKTLGILSESTSDIKLVIGLAP